MLAFALLCRLLLLFSFPNLSDDIYRFIWDGRMIHEGLNPYAHLPTDIVDTSKALGQELFNNLNSPSYFTIYPPIAQFVFYISTFANSADLLQETITMKAIFLVVEVANFYLIYSILKLLQSAPERIYLYALNPLIIIELFGNAHIESLLVFSVLLLIYMILKGREIASGITMAGAISIKLIPALFMPAILWKLPSNKARVRFLISAGMAGAILFIPLLLGTINTISNMGSSVDLFFRKFEFNASIYYVLRYVGYQITGYNQIARLGPFLIIIMAATVIYLAFKSEKNNNRAFITLLLMSFTAYLFSTTIIHPWYLSIPIVLSVFTPFRFPIIWSYLIFLSYVNYSYNPYYENLWCVATEYSVVITYMWIEIKRYGVYGQKIKGWNPVSGANPS